MTQPTTKPAWSGRCNCYNEHRSSSGRCRCRTSRLPETGEYIGGVLDPTRYENELAICEDCRKYCPAGNGTRLQPKEEPKE